jgi:hypothetical protein
LVLDRMGVEQRFVATEEGAQFGMPRAAVTTSPWTGKHYYLTSTGPPELS